MRGTVASIQIAPAPGAAMKALPQVRAHAGRGLEGDHRCLPDQKPGAQATLIEIEAIEALQRDYAVALEPQNARRNIVTRGIALNHLVDREFTVGDVRMRGIQLCEPCSHLARLSGAKVLPGLVHRGGLNAEILSDGTVRVGDEIVADSSQVAVVHYDPRWPGIYEAERARIAAAIPQVAIEHIGSTSVPGLAAKPIIDILVGVPRVPIPREQIEAVCALGYVHRGENGIPGRHFFNSIAPKTAHIHLVEHGSPFWRDHLLFRDVLRGRSDVAREYAELKRRLAVEFSHNRVAYTDAKAPFITKVLDEARRSGRA